MRTPGVMEVHNTLWLIWLPLPQGQHRTAIQHLQRVLEISSEMEDHVGDADAYGTIADIYTEMGHFERAAEYYDKYIERMSADGPV